MLLGESHHSWWQVLLYLQREGQIPEQEFSGEGSEYEDVGFRHIANSNVRTRLPSLNLHVSPRELSLLFCQGSGEPIVVEDDDQGFEGQGGKNGASLGEDAIPTEQQQRAVLFGVPRTSEDEEDVMISMLCHTVLPLVLDDGRLIIKRLGEIENKHPNYHTAKHIFPVGFRVRF